MIEQAITQIKTGSIKNVVRFGDDRPAAPYVVVKDEGQSEFDPGTSVRIITHMEKGQQKFLTSYVRGELYDLINDVILEDEDGNRNSLLSTGERSGIITNNDDGTLSMERVFLLPEAAR